MILDDLSAVIRDRKENPQPDSYVSSLLASGRDEILKKIGEEAVEVILASKGEDRQQVIHELADLWLHCMAHMPEGGVTHNDVLSEL